MRRVGFLRCLREPGKRFQRWFREQRLPGNVLSLGSSWVSSPAQFDRLLIGAVALESADGARIVALLGEQDLATLPKLEETLSTALAEGHPVIIDLSGVTFIDGATVSLITRARGEAETRGVALVLAIGEKTPRAVELVLEAAGCLAAPWVTRSREKAIDEVMGRGS